MIEPRALLTRDTSVAIEERQIAMWRAQSPEAKLDLVRGAYRAARALAFAGLRERHPEASEQDLLRRYVELTAGVDLARQAFGDPSLP